MKNHIFCLLLFFSPLFSYPQVTYLRTYDNMGTESANYVDQTADSGFIFTGYAGNSGMDTDIYLIRTNSNGDTLWTRTFIGIGSERGNCVKQTADGGFIITGGIESLASGSDIYIIKTNSNGDTVWTKTYGGLYYDEGFCTQQTLDGNFIITGILGEGDSAGVNILLMKININGDTLWTKSIDWSGNEAGYYIQECSDGGIVITGYMSNNIGFTDVYLAKADSTGNLLWLKRYAETTSDIGYNVQQTSDGGYMIGSLIFNYPGGGFADYFLIKTDSNGDLLWSKIYGESNYDKLNSLQQTSDGGFILTGWTHSFGAGNDNNLLIKVDSVGSLIWAKMLGSYYSEIGRFAVGTFDSGVICVGSTYSYPNPNPGNIFLLKTDSAGNVGCTSINVTPNVTSYSPIVVNTTPLVFSGLNIMSPDIQVGSGGTTSVLCSSVGLTEIASQNTTYIYPNPFSNQTILQVGTELKKATMLIFDSYGKLVRKIDQLNGQTVLINRDNLSSGLYTFQIIQEDRIVYIDKFIISN